MMEQSQTLSGPQDLTGPQKASIFLLAMGEEYTARVMRGMGPQEIQKLGSHMKSIQHVRSDVLSSVLREYLDRVENSDELLVQGGAFLKNVINRSFDHNKARDIAKQLDKDEAEEPFAYIENIDPQALVRIIAGEHPQTVALILAHLKPDRAAAILTGLPSEIQGDVAMRIADLNQVPVEIINEVDHTLHKEVMTLGESGGREVGGLQMLANILNEVDKNTEETVFTDLEESRQEMAEQVRQLMFVFEDLIRVDDRGIRELLKQVDTKELVVALKSASEPMKEKIFANLSSRAAEMLREDMAVMGPVRLAEVEQAQQGIIRIARQLESEGKIVIAKGKEDVLV